MHIQNVVVVDIDIHVVLEYTFMYQCVIAVPNNNLLLHSQTVDCYLEIHIPSLL